MIDGARRRGRRVLLRAACAAAALVATVACGAARSGSARAPWMPDRGDGTYRNPILFADYSDPDAIRVGRDYFMVSSSFLAAPGLPILHSRDLVNWTIVNHVFATQLPAAHFSTPRHGEGVWAPAIRYHDGRFWVFYPDPDFGIYVSTATDAFGAWSTPTLVAAGKGLIDPCPFWDDDGTLYMIHAWARSRSGIANVLTLRTLSPDGTQMVGDGAVIIDGNAIPGWTTLEGPKLYKRNGYYYVFAPAGGVTRGYQAVFRSRQIRGPYEHRIVLEQGTTAINGPHQGAWVDTVAGEDWFLHFQDLAAYGRVVHLQPMRWRVDDWPVMGADADGDGTGEPVLVHAKPRVGGRYPAAAPQTSDEFSAPVLGRQWQWNANPRSDWASLTARKGSLRLATVPSADQASLYDAPNLLLQKFPAREFVVTTTLEFAPRVDGERAGLVVFGFDYFFLGLRRDADRVRLVAMVNTGANRTGAIEREIARADVRSGPIVLRVTVSDGAVCRFAYSTDERTFVAAGEPFTASGDRWIGAKVGLVALGPPRADASGHADFDWFRITPLVPPSSGATPHK